MKECANCGFLNDYGACDCPHSDKWYACPIETKKPENIKALKEYAEWAGKAESKDKLDGDPIDIDKAVEHYEGTLETLKGIDLEVDG